MTNFLRDVGEDVTERDRIYLPRAALERFGVAVQDVEARRFTDEFAIAMEQGLQRVEDRYRGASPAPVS